MRKPTVVTEKRWGVVSFAQKDARVYCADRPYLKVVRLSLSYTLPKGAK